MLKLARRLVDVLGESPESLRDLSVSLYKLGDVYRGVEQLEAARHCFNEGLHLAEWLTHLLPDIPQYVELSDYFETALTKLE